MCRISLPGFGIHLSNKAEYMGQSWLNQAIVFDWSVLGTQIKYSYTLKPFSVMPYLPSLDDVLVAGDRKGGQQVEFLWKELSNAVQEC